MIIIAVMLLGLGVVMILIALSTLLSAASTLVKYHRLAQLPPPERPWTLRMGEPRVVGTGRPRGAA